MLGTIKDIIKKHNGLIVGIFGVIISLVLGLPSFISYLKDNIYQEKVLIECSEPTLLNEDGNIIISYFKERNSAWIRITRSLKISNNSDKEVAFKKAIVNNGKEIVEFKDFNYPNTNFGIDKENNYVYLPFALKAFESKILISYDSYLLSNEIVEILSNEGLLIKNEVSVKSSILQNILLKKYNRDLFNNYIKDYKEEKDNNSYFNSVDPNNENNNFSYNTVDKLNNYINEFGNIELITSKGNSFNGKFRLVPTSSF